MKRWLPVLLACVMLMMAGCGGGLELQPTETAPAETTGSAVAVPWSVQYIRTNGPYADLKYPGVQIIKSAEQLQDYYSANKDIYYLERRDPDVTVGFLDACDAYGEAFFAENYLVFVLLEEGSGSVYHEVRSVEQTAAGKLCVRVDSLLPGGVGTCDMAQWHVILELSRDVEVESSADVQVYWNGHLRWNGEYVELPKPEPSFLEPPAGTVRTPDGDVELQLGGYSWTVEHTDGTVTTEIADQVSRPLPQNGFQAVALDSDYAETVYLPVPGSDVYAPTNCLGYPMKLDWLVYPTSVTYTCWPDAVWQQGDTPEEDVHLFRQDFSFYAKPGGYIYEITATWENTGEGYYGTAYYYVYILGGNEVA